jgi:hypothetical protein
MLIQDVSWALGNGTGVVVKGQPWFEGWEDQGELEELTISGLVSPNCSVWDMPKLRSIFDEATVRMIQEPVLVPNRNARLLDRLIWCHTKSDQYRVKEG